MKNCESLGRNIVSEEFRILTQKAKGHAHSETLVRIDWEGITEDQLRILARRALIYQFQLSVQKDLIPGVPEAVTIIARDHAADRTPILEVVFAPKVKKVHKNSAPDIEELLGQLSPEERAVLFADLETT